MKYFKSIVLLSIISSSSVIATNEKVTLEMANEDMRRAAEWITYADSENGLKEPDFSGNQGGIEVLLWSKSGGLSKGDFVLNQPYSNFDKIKVYGSNDIDDSATVQVWDTADFDYFINNNASSRVIGIWHFEAYYWTGRWLSDKRTFKTARENSKLQKITGVNN